MGALWAPVQQSWIEPRLAAMRPTTNTHEYFSGANDLEIPDLAACQFVPERLAPWHSRKDYPGAAVHYFLDDYRFESIWRNPPATLDRLRAAEAVLSPDFSLWSEDPWPVTLWQIYRARWMGAYWQSRGLRVIPTAEYAMPAQAWHFTGLPKGSVIAFQGYGNRTPDAADLYEDGVRMMIDLLEPTVLLCYGRFPERVAPPRRVVEFTPFTEARLRALDARKAAEATDGER
jgi:hypothetical protein